MCLYIQVNLKNLVPIWTWVYVKHVWRRGDISHHQPMNWRDSIWASDNRSLLGVPTAVSYAASHSLLREQGLRKLPETFFKVCSFMHSVLGRGSFSTNSSISEVWRGSDQPVAQLGHYWAFSSSGLLDRLFPIITIKRTKDLNYFSLCGLNLFNTRVSQFELNYGNKWTFPRHSNLLRCTCISHWKSLEYLNPQ